MDELETELEGNSAELIAFCLFTKIAEKEPSLADGKDAVLDLSAEWMNAVVRPHSRVSTLTGTALRPKD